MGMLTEEERNALLKSVQRVRHVAVLALRQLPNSSHAIAFVANLHRSVDRVAMCAAKAGSTPECKAGCAYCCRVRVEATEPEILRISRTLGVFPPMQLAALVDRLRAHLAQAGAVQDQERQDCPFLVNKLCSIYEVRPATCRKAHSLLARKCEIFALELPQNLDLLLQSEALMLGTAEAYRELNLPASPHELVAAVLTALTEPSAEACWYNGQSLF
jgi:Fe-S-cluster containining protein